MGKGSVWQVRDTPYPDVEPDVFVKGKLHELRRADQKKKDRIEVERMCDCVVACKGMRTNIRKMEVVEDFVSRPHQHVRFEARSEDLACPTAVAKCQRGKICSVKDSVEGARKVMSKNDTQRVAEEGSEAEKKSGNQSGKGPKYPCVKQSGMRPKYPRVRQTGMGLKHP